MWSVDSAARLERWALATILALGVAASALRAPAAAAAPMAQTAPPAAAAVAAVAQAGSRQVIVNGVLLRQETLDALEQRYGLRALDGDYWYDRATGAFGLRGGPTLGFVLPGLDLGGRLAAGASGGGSGTLTGVFVNGREIHPLDALALQQLFGAPPLPGFYWMDAQGFFGAEGGPALGNLIYVAAARGATGSSYIRESYAGYIGGDGQTSYFFDPNTGCSVMTGGGVSC
jgi:hypothetical protein